jgi:hypothetical protein
VKLDVLNLPTGQPTHIVAPADAENFPVEQLTQFKIGSEFEYFPAVQGKHEPLREHILPKEQEQFAFQISLYP